MYFHQFNSLPCSKNQFTPRFGIIQWLSAS